MSAYIKNFKLPPPGKYRACVIVDEFGARLTVDVATSYSGHDLRLYPIIPVPAHGRLGDMDAIARKIRRFGDYVDFTKDEIAGWFENGDFETIIPAEEADCHTSDTVTGSQ